MQQRSLFLWIGVLGMTALGATASPAQDGAARKGGQGGGQKRSAAQAQGGEGAGAAERPAGGARAQKAEGGAAAPAGAAQMAGSILLHTLDRDGDLTLSAGEIDLSVVSLRALDKDGDGAITAAEMTRPARAETPPAPAEGAGAGELPDADGDGKITEADLGPALKPHFAEFDANGDGELDAAEQQKALAKMKAQHAKGAPGAAGAAGAGAKGAAAGGKKGAGKGQGTAKSQQMKKPGKKKAG